MIIRCSWRLPFKFHRSHVEQIDRRTSMWDRQGHESPRGLLKSEPIHPPNPHADTAPARYTSMKTTWIWTMKTDPDAPIGDHVANLEETHLKDTARAKHHQSTQDQIEATKKKLREEQQCVDVDHVLDHVKMKPAVLAKVTTDQSNFNIWLKDYHKTPQDNAGIKTDVIELDDDNIEPFEEDQTVEKEAAMSSLIKGKGMRLLSKLMVKEVPSKPVWKLELSTVVKGKPKSNVSGAQIKAGSRPVKVKEEQDVDVKIEGSDAGDNLVVKRKKCDRPTNDNSLPSELLENKKLWTIAYLQPILQHFLKNSAYEVAKKDLILVFKGPVQSSLLPQK
ncbi:hypothetical protein JOM56_015321 [Amanita muscaria]